MLPHESVSWCVLHIKAAITILLLVGSLSCGIPRDPAETLASVRGGTLRVGIIENQHWAQLTDGEPRGIETALVREFAAFLGARPEWVAGSAHELMEALKKRELDLVIGGLTDSTLWSKEVGLTAPYFENRFVVGTPPAAIALREVDGVEVAVRRGDSLAARLEDEGARVLRVEDPFAAGRPVAAAEWEIAAHGFAPTEIELHTEQHVIATPPGENRFLIELERFLFERRGRVQEMLRDELREESQREVTP